MAALAELLFTCRSALLPFSQRCKYVSCSSGILRNNHHDVTVNQDHYDIIVTGGGMIGATLACAIANNRRLDNKRVLLLETNKQSNYIPQENYSNRVVALNKNTRILLSSIGAWNHIEEGRYGNVKRMQVWDACSDAMITFDEEHLSEELAYIVETDLLQHAVNEELSKKSNVDVLYNSQVQDIELCGKLGENSRITLKDGKQYTTKLLVGADGIKSRVREAMGVQYLKWDYNQMGIVATLELSEPTENVVAWQRFLPTGPIALLPLTDSLSSLVWSVTNTEAKKLLKTSEEEFVDNINDALWKVYPKDGIVESGMAALQQLLAGLSLHTGGVRQIQPSIQKIVEGSRAAFPLGFGHSVIYAKTGVVLIGDAAHRVHPLAGQGVNLGFGDIAILIQCLVDTLLDGAYLGDPKYLTKYETLRQRHNVPTMLTIDTLHRLYKGTAAPIVLARSLGLQITNALPFVKKAMMKHASDQTTCR